MFVRGMSIALAGLCLAIPLQDSALAQHITPRPRVHVPATPRVHRAPGAAYSQGINRQRLNKPHSNVDIYRQPTVSPYLNLLTNEGSDVELPNYQTLVRPMVEQQQAQRTQYLGLQRLEQQFQQFQNQQAIPPAGSSELRPTGHAVRFMNLSHYYPSAR